MRNFKHYHPETIEEAVSILKEFNGNAKVVAGGTDLFGGLKDEIHPFGPQALVDLKTGIGLGFIRSEEKHVSIGSLTRLKDIEKNSLINETVPLLAEAAQSVASPQIRNMASIGGNLCQEPRCWYYRNPNNTFDCHRKGGSRCNAMLGDNRFHSVFGAARIVSTSCRQACPAHTAIPEYLEKIRANDVDKAARIILDFNPMPAITGRVCPHFCQSGCNRSHLDTPVSIRNIERFVGDYILENISDLFVPPSKRTQKKIAVIGAGPGGLSAAYFLRKAGHQVTIFDRMPKAGGMLTYAIPAYRLPKSVVDNTVSAIAGTGVEFRLNIKIGEDISINEIKQAHDAVLLATGAWISASIGLLGEDLAISGLEFLTNSSNNIQNCSGKKILVIGGGNVAVDVAVTAVRQGAASVTMACLEKRDHMPCNEWEIEEALAEGIGLLDGFGPEKLEKVEKNQIDAKLMKCTAVFNAENCFDPKFDPSDVRELIIDQVILAVGQKTDFSFLDPGMETIEDNGLTKVIRKNQSTEVKGVYACGDAANGPATIVEAVASGRKAAIAVEKYLTGRSSLIEQELTNKNELSDITPESFRYSETSPMPTIDPSQKGLSLEDYSGLDKSAVLNESKRCLNCGCIAVSPTDMGPALVAVNAEIITTKREIPASHFFQAGLMSSTVLDKDELVTEIRVPLPDPNSFQMYLKFRLRNAIDFPIVSLAALLETDKSRILNARIVFGAVAPVPMRATLVEDIIRGSELSDHVIDKACEAAVKNAKPLQGNGYKINIIKALLKRALIDARMKIMF